MSENESRSEGKVTDLMEALSVSLERAKADRRAPAPRADEGAERSKPHLLHGVFDSDGLTRFRLECPYEVKGVLPAGRRCWSLDDDGEIDSLQCFAKGWVDECGAELISFEITDPSFPIEVDVELHGLLQTPNLTLHVRSASSGDGGAPTPDRAEMFRALLWDARDYLAAHIDWTDPDAGEESMVQRIDTACGDRPTADRNIVPPSAAERAAAPSPVLEEGPPSVGVHEAVGGAGDPRNYGLAVLPDPALVPGDGPLCWLPEGRWVRQEPDAEAKRLREEVERLTLRESLAEHWSECFLPPDALCAQCHAYSALGNGKLTVERAKALLANGFAPGAWPGATPEQGEGPAK